MKHYGLTIDPGMSTGVCLFSWGDDDLGYFRQEAVWQFPGGASGLAKFLDYTGVKIVGHEPWMTSKGIHLQAIVVEKFTPLSKAGFSLTQASAEPLRGEGVLIGRGMEPFIHWAEPAQQYFMGGEDLPAKKRRSREFLKLFGLYVTGSMIGQKDADDAISAELHAIAWLRRRRHRPTLNELFAPEEEE